ARTTCSPTAPRRSRLTAAAGPTASTCCSSPDLLLPKVVARPVPGAERRSPGRRGAAETDRVVVRLGIRPPAEGGSDPFLVGGGEVAAADDALRAAGRALGVGGGLGRVRPVPVGRPLPHVAGEIEHAGGGSARREGADGRRAGEAVVFVEHRL